MLYFDNDLNHTSGLRELCELCGVVPYAKCHKTLCTTKTPTPLALWVNVTYTQLIKVYTICCINLHKEIYKYDDIAEANIYCIALSFNST